jgi:hypothetical protein
MPYAHRKDETHKPIADALTRAGGFVEDASRDPRRGYDILCHWHGRSDHIEVKTPATRNDLTPNEQRVKAELEARGIPYIVIVSVDEALALKGATHAR